MLPSKDTNSTTNPSHTHKTSHKKNNSQKIQIPEEKPEEFEDIEVINETYKKFNSITYDISELNKFKNDILIFFKERDNFYYKKLKHYKSNLDTSEFNFNSTSKLINNNYQNIIQTQAIMNSRLDQLKNYETFSAKTNDKLVSHEIRINNLREDLSKTCQKYDKIYLDNLELPGFIGRSAKYKNCQLFFTDVIRDLAKLNKFREKNIIDLAGYKEKLENIINSFNILVDNNNKAQMKYINESYDKVTNDCNKMMQILEERIKDIRVENSKYTIDLIKQSEELSKKWNIMQNIRSELMEQFTYNINKYQMLTDDTIKSFGEFKLEYNVIRRKFMELVEFIKDVRFRKNLGGNIKKSEIKSLVKKITGHRNNGSMDIDPKSIRILNDITNIENLDFNKMRNDFESEKKNNSQFKAKQNNLNDNSNRKNFFNVAKRNYNEVSPNKLLLTNQSHSPENRKTIDKIKNNYSLSNNKSKYDSNRFLNQNSNYYNTEDNLKNESNMTIIDNYNSNKQSIEINNNKKNKNEKQFVVNGDIIGIKNQHQLECNENIAIKTISYSIDNNINKNNNNIKNNNINNNNISNSNINNKFKNINETNINAQNFNFQIKNINNDKKNDNVNKESIINNRNYDLIYKKNKSKKEVFITDNINNYNLIHKKIDNEKRETSFQDNNINNYDLDHKKNENEKKEAIIQNNNINYEPVHAKNENEKKEVIIQSNSINFESVQKKIDDGKKDEFTQENIINYVSTDKKNNIGKEEEPTKSNNINYDPIHKINDNEEKELNIQENNDYSDLPNKNDDNEKKEILIQDNSNNYDSINKKSSSKEELISTNLKNNKIKEISNNIENIIQNKFHTENTENKENINNNINNNFKKSNFLQQQKSNPETNRRFSSSYSLFIRDKPLLASEETSFISETSSVNNGIYPQNNTTSLENNISIVSSTNSIFNNNSNNNSNIRFTVSNGNNYATQIANDRIIKELASELEQSTAKKDIKESDKKKIDDNFKDICKNIEPMNLLVNTNNMNINHKDNIICDNNSKHNKNINNTPINVNNEIYLNEGISGSLCLNKKISIVNQKILNLELFTKEKILELVNQINLLKENYNNNTSITNNNMNSKFSFSSKELTPMHEKKIFNLNSIVRSNIRKDSLNTVIGGKSNIINDFLISSNDKSLIENNKSIFNCGNYHSKKLSDLNPRQLSVNGIKLNKKNILKNNISQFQEKNSLLDSNNHIKKAGVHLKDYVSGSLNNKQDFSYKFLKDENKNLLKTTVEENFKNRNNSMSNVGSSPIARTSFLTFNGVEIKWVDLNKLVNSQLPRNRFYPIVSSDENNYYVQINNNNK